MFDKQSISYSLNSFGYRCPEFDRELVGDPGCFRLVTIGGSDTFGIGVPFHDLYVNLLAAMLEDFTGKSVVAWNLGLPMAGPDYMARMLLPVISNLAPDLLLLKFPNELGYKEYINDSGEVFFCEPVGLGSRRRINRFRDPELARVDRAHCKLHSRFNDTANFFNNYYFCEYLCEQSRINWLFSAPGDARLGKGAKSLKKKYRVVDLMSDNTQPCDEGAWFARDFIHPGTLPHRKYAEEVFRCYVTEYAPGSTNE